MIREHKAVKDMGWNSSTLGIGHTRHKQQTALDVKQKQDNQEASQRLTADRAVMVVEDMLED